MVGPLGASIRLLRTNCGLPDMDSLPVTEQVGLYNSVSDALLKEGIQKEFCTPERLSELVLDMRAFMDQRYGRLSDEENRRMTMIPAHVFRDLAADGKFFLFLRAIFEYAEKNGVDVDFDEDEDVGEDLLEAGESGLKKMGWLKTRKVFISPLVEDEEEEKLRDILQRHGAVMVSNSLVATHILYPDPDGTLESQTDGQALVRVLKRKKIIGKEFAFLHWFYHPDSYDDWVPGDEVLGYEYQPRVCKEKEQWHVHARWVRDLDVHNEWMNELDYEMPDTFDDYVGRSPRPPKLDASGRPYNPLVRLRLRMPTPAHPKKDGGEEEIAAELNRGGLDVNRGANGESSSENTIGGHFHGEGIRGVDLMKNLNELVGVVKAPNDQSSGDECDDRFMLDAVTNGSLQPQDTITLQQQPSKIPVGNGVFIPFFVQWFNMQAVHEIEKRALPEFFQGRFPSKNERTYQEIRNYMVQTWRKNSHQYLSGTAARRHLAGDACCVLRVHGFLEHWGLINYGCLADGTVPQLFAPPPRPLPLHAGNDGDDSARVKPQLIADSGSRLQVRDGKVIKFGRNDEVLGNGRTESVLIRDTDQNGNVTSIAEPPQREPIEYHCDSCGIDCSVLRFHCAVKADVDLCSPCYHQDKYDVSMKPRDFIQMNSAGVNGGNDETDPDAWTESETLLLLEALEMYGDNWSLVSEHVGSKGKTQCVIQFLRLPIEDTFLNQTTKNWWATEPIDPEEISPAEMMRRAGAKESALAVMKNGGTGKQFSGQPLVFGDQLSTVAAFAGGLCAQTPPDLMKELTRLMGTGNARRSRSFWKICEAEDTLGSEKKRATDEELLSKRLYLRAKKSLYTPATLLRTEQGRQIARGALSLINHGAIADEEVDSLLVRPAPQELVQKHEGNGVRLEYMNGDGNRQGDGERGRALSMESANALKMADGDVESCTAMSMTALAATCATTAHREGVEEAEIGRLRSVIRNVREELISKRREHREMIGNYEEFERKYKKMKMCEEMREMIDRKMARLRVEKKEKERRENMAMGDYRAEFSGEVALQKTTRGAERNGRMIAEEREEAVVVEVEDEAMYIDRRQSGEGLIVGVPETRR